MIKKIIASIAVILLVGAGVWAVSRSDSTDPKSERLQVVASFYPLYDFTKQIGGQYVDVSSMTPAGAEPHDFEPAAKNLAHANQADVFVYNGGIFEPWTTKFLDGFKGTKIAAGSQIQQRDDDPHFWLDPVLARQMVNTIRDGLTRADPAHAEQYIQNAAAYNQKLIGLDEQFKQGLAECEQRTIIVSHESMAYLAARYDLKVEAIAGLSPESEPNTARLAELSDIVKQKGIKYVFFESLTTPRLADAIAAESGAETLVLDPIEGLTDEDQKAGKDYISVQQDSLKNLRHALSCQ